MDKIQKLLARLSVKERKQLQAVLALIVSGVVDQLDVKKLAGRQDIYRVRKGAFRILLLKTNRGWNIISVERRSDTTYS